MYKKIFCIRGIAQTWFATINRITLVLLWYCLTCIDLFNASFVSVFHVNGVWSMWTVIIVKHIVKALSAESSWMADEMGIVARQHESSCLNQSPAVSDALGQVSLLSALSTISTNPMGKQPYTDWQAVVWNCPPRPFTLTFRLISLSLSVPSSPDTISV